MAFSAGDLVVVEKVFVINLRLVFGTCSSDMKVIVQERTPDGWISSDTAVPREKIIGIFRKHWLK